MADPWVKIWWTWYSSRSHLGLSGTALALGAPLMLLCKASPDADSARHSDGAGDGDGDDPSDVVFARTPAGKPVTLQAIASTAHFSVDDTRAALDELIGVGTVVVSADGAYGLVNFWKYQESPSAARMRKLRAQRDADSARHSDGAGDGKKAEGRGKKAEVRKQSATRGRAREAELDELRSLLTAWDGAEGMSVSPTDRATVEALMPRMRELASEWDPSLSSPLLPWWRWCVGRWKSSEHVRLRRLRLCHLLEDIERVADPSWDDAGGVDHSRAGTREEHERDLEHDWLDKLEREEAQA